MVYKKLVTLSSLVLVLAVIAINAGRSKGGKKGQSKGSDGEPSKETMYVMAYCLNCPKIKNVMAANRACVKAVIPDIVKPADDKTGDSCMESMLPKKSDGSPAHMQMDSDKKDRLTKCYDTMINKGGAEFKACYDAAIAAWEAKRKA